MLRYVTLLVGTVILLGQQFGIGPSDITLKVIGIACFGPVTAQSAATIFTSIRGAGSDAGAG